MSGLYFFGAILSIIVGVVLVTMTILANYTFEKPASIATGETICDGSDFNERCGELYLLGTNTVGNANG